MAYHLLLMCRVELFVAAETALLRSARVAAWSVANGGRWSRFSIVAREHRIVAGIARAGSLGPVVAVARAHASRPILRRKRPRVVSGTYAAGAVAIDRGWGDAVPIAPVVWGVIAGIPACAASDGGSCGPACAAR